MCDCIEKANAALAEHNTAVDTKLTISLESGKAQARMYVPTRKIKGSGKKAVNLFPSFCPLCGEAQTMPPKIGIGEGAST